MVEWLFKIAESSPALSSISGLTCFALAVVVGAFRQLCLYMFRRTSPIRMSDQDGKEKTIYLGPNPPGIWFSLKFRGVSWLFVAITSTWAATTVATLISPPRGGPLSHLFLGTFILVLVSRVALSGILVRWSQVVSLWQATIGLGPRFLRGHAAFVESLSFSSNGRWLTTKDTDGRVILWNLATGRKAHTLEDSGAENRGEESKIRVMAPSPDGRRLAFTTGARTVKVWEIASGHEPRIFDDHPYPVTATAISPDGQWLAAACGKDDCQIKLWDAANRCSVCVLKAPGEVCVMAFSPDSRCLAAGGSRDSSVIVWEVATGREVRRLDLRDQELQELHDTQRRRWAAQVRAAGGRVDEGFSEALQVQPWALGFSADGRLLAVASDATFLWDLVIGRKVRVLRHPWKLGKGGFATDVAFSSDGRWLATAHPMETEATVWEVETGREVLTKRGYRPSLELPEIPVAVAFSPEGQLLFAQSYKSTVSLWDVTVEAESGGSRSRGRT